MIAELWVFRVEEGLGNACALFFPDGSGAVIDWGTARDEPLDLLVERLMRSERPRLRFVAATHSHADHTLGIAPLLKRLHDRGVLIDRLVYPSPLAGSRANQLRAARTQARDLNIPMSTVTISTLPLSQSAPMLAYGINPANHRERWAVRAVAPSDIAIANVELQSEEAGGPPGNPSSLVLQFAFERDGVPLDRGRAILPGDATPATLDYALRRSEQHPELSLVNDAIVVPHHGSRHNWTPWLSDTIRGVAIVSAPSGATKHPAEQVLKGLVQVCGGGQDSRLFCTSYAGACHLAFVESVIEPAFDAPSLRDPCGGHIAVRLSSEEPASAFRYDSKLPQRRKYGYCGR